MPDTTKSDAGAIVPSANVRLSVDDAAAAITALPSPFSASGVFGCCAAVCANFVSALFAPPPRPTTLPPRPRPPRPRPPLRRPLSSEAMFMLNRWFPPIMMPPGGFRRRTAGAAAAAAAAAGFVGAVPAVACAVNAGTGDAMLAFAGVVGKARFRLPLPVPKAAVAVVEPSSAAMSSSSVAPSAMTASSISELSTFVVASAAFRFSCCCSRTRADTFRVGFRFDWCIEIPRFAFAAVLSNVLAVFTGGKSNLIAEPDGVDTLVASPSPSLFCAAATVSAPAPSPPPSLLVPACTLSPPGLVADRAEPSDEKRGLLRWTLLNAFPPKLSLRLSAPSAPAVLGLCGSASPTPLPPPPPSPSWMESNFVGALMGVLRSIGAPLMSTPSSFAFIILILRSNFFHRNRFFFFGRPFESRSKSSSSALFRRPTRPLFASSSSALPSPPPPR